ncbi:hypothetical protein O6H91_01G073600 [Diphasiastrum complanatum]|uniref:Uncharacterized protein n=1 Tax=Diphasiastrum complanatum TaxID=34168 RepID=A0ACC2ES49_DIPCM|nr:hypothetical protein O6H91_01G073600 [Diphasiastrum complanatum]
MASYDEEFVAAVSSIALAGDGLVLGAGMALLALRTWLKYRSHAKALKRLEDTPLSHIADLRSLLLLNPEEQSARDGSKSEYNSKSVPQIASKEQQHEDVLVIVRGSVQPKSYVDSNGRGQNEEIVVAENAGQKAVLVEKSQTFLYNEKRGIFGWRLEWRGLFGWSSLKEKVTNSRKMVPFVLVEGFAGKRPAFICVDLADSRHPLPLTTVSHQLYPAQASSYTFLQAMFGQRYMDAHQQEHMTHESELFFKDRFCFDVKWIFTFLADQQMQQTCSSSIGFIYIDISCFKVFA